MCVCKHALEWRLEVCVHAMSMLARGSKVGTGAGWEKRKEKPATYKQLHVSTIIYGRSISTS